MGGSNSGRRRTSKVGDVESYPQLDIRELKRHGAIQRGAMTITERKWCRNYTREPVASYLVTVDLRDEYPPCAVIMSSIAGVPTQTVDIVAVPMRYGGERFYFLCPNLGTRCEVLVNISGMFLSRQASRLSYQSNNQCTLGRLSKAHAKLEEKLHPPDGRRKPRGDHRWQLHDRLDRVDEARDKAVRDRFAPYMAMRQRLEAELSELELSGWAGVWPRSQDREATE